MISISNIAWDVSIDNQMAETLQALGVGYIDIAPPKYFNQPSKTSKDEILKVKEYWRNKGIEPLGMQALLFGTQGLNVFGSASIQDQLLSHLADICRIGNILGARKLVFGSPRNRDRAHLNDQQTNDMALDFFGRLGDIALNENVVICLEPNPVAYHANFMTNSLETVDIVQQINHKNIRMQLDIGAMLMNDEVALEIIKKVAPWVHHIHISEPHLAPLNIDNLYHLDAAKAIKQYLPKMPMTIEMLSTNNSTSLAEIEQAIYLIKKTYQDN